MSRIRIGEDAVVHPSAQLGGPFRQLLSGERGSAHGDVTIGERCWIGGLSWLGDGVTIGAGSIVDNGCLIEPGVTIGESVLITHGAQICSDAVIADGCVIGGFVGDRTVIGERSRFFGRALHSQNDPSKPWDADESNEPAPEIRADSFVAFGAAVIGAVTIGPRAYVCANAVVTRSVPPGYIASKVNHLTHFTQWSGRLSESPLFKRAG